jgi:hypothetical protein
VIGNKLELEIIGLFNRDINLLLSINQIAKKLNKAYPYINSKVNDLIKEGILNKVEVGRSYLCSINLENEKAIVLLSLNEIYKKEKQLKKTPKAQHLLQELKSIKQQFKTYTVYLEKKQLTFVLDHIHDKEAIKNNYKEIKKFDLIFLTKTEFHNTILNNISVLKNKTVLYSPETYFELLNEIKDQLIGKSLK